MAENKNTPRLNSKVEGRMLVMDRVFGTSRKKVFQAFSDSSHIEKWWGPSGWKTKNHTFEFKPKGVWHYCMTCKDKKQGDFYGQTSWGKGIYQEIIPLEKIVYIDIFSDEEANTALGMSPVLVTVLFKDRVGHTHLEVRNQFESEDALQNLLDMGVVEGFTSQFDCLDSYLNLIK